jgi:hypothetical protein
VRVVGEVDGAQDPARNVHGVMKSIGRAAEATREDWT